MTTIIVKVAKLPGQVKETVLEDDATVQDALNAAGISVIPGETIKIGAEDATVDDTVSDGDYVIISAGAKNA